MYVGNRERLKQAVSVFLYSAFLLAEGGEFFVSHSEKSPDAGHDALKGEAVQKAELPTHLPEKISEGRLKISRTCFQPVKETYNIIFAESGDKGGELCIEN